MVRYDAAKKVPEAKRWAQFDSEPQNNDETLERWFEAKTEYKKVVIDSYSIDPLYFETMFDASSIMYGDGSGYDICGPRSY